MSGAPDYEQIYRTMNSRKLVTEAWEEPIVDLSVRNVLVKEMMERSDAWPSAAMAARDEMAGLYPDPEDPQFAARLYAKREFYEARSVAAGVAEGSVDPCTSAAAEAVFELTPVQRIVSRFLHPSTPYNGMLLYHGVGVGKTCSAVTIAEQFLEQFPTTKVIVIVPQALQDNFKKTVFDPSKLKWSATAGTWQSRQCTGTAYLERLGLMDNPDIKVVTQKTEDDKRNRYTVTGYQAFALWIGRTLSKSVPADLKDPALRRAAENEVLRRLFSDHLIIVDEAHNLRDVAAGEDDGQVAAPGDLKENAGGKALNPLLRRIVLIAEGLRLVLMTATPMYNSAPEIVLLLNYLYMNDTKRESDAMKASAMFTADGALIPGASQKLEAIARRYVSYMRGENPYTFPLRMRPRMATEAPASKWPTISATKTPVAMTDEDRAALNALPLVFTEPVEGSPIEKTLRGATVRGRMKAVTESSESSDASDSSEASNTADTSNTSNTSNASNASEAPTSDTMLDIRMQMANITYSNAMYGNSGWDYHFTQNTTAGVGHKLNTFTPKAFDIDSVFADEGLRTHAPKIHKIVNSVRSAAGISFVYSRYIKSGALSLAIALERAGFQRRMADGRLTPLLTGAPPVAPICAVCSKRDGAEHGQEHTFRPACYILLISDDDISPNFSGLVKQAITWDDAVYGPQGSNVKVIIGSQVASEGLDLKCIREVHILDSWYHLNRTDQIIGRAIRYCSHSALRAVEENQGLPPMSLNNCTIHLHVLLLPEIEGGEALETADMYAYRIAIGKAQMVGKVQRLLKKNAWDCNLELEAITFAGLPPRVQYDAQGTRIEEYNVNDQDYTTYCDYQVCAHQCAVAGSSAHIDSSTFSLTDARRLILAKQTLVRNQFMKQVMVPEPIIQSIFSDLPHEIASEALMELIDGRRFQLTRPDGVRGFLVKKAGYIVFQPAGVADTDIPIAMRYSQGFQMRRHTMIPQAPVWGSEREEVVAPSVADAGAGAGAGAGSESGTGPVNAEPGMVTVADTIKQNWAQWVACVDSHGAANLPTDMSATHRLWRWILREYADVPGLRKVALQWWVDKTLTYREQRQFIELVARNGVPDVTLAMIWGSDSFVNPTMIRYRIFNPETTVTEHYSAPAAGGPFTRTGDTQAALFDKFMNKARPTIKYPEDTGTLFGFLANKVSKIVFKTMDTTKEKSHSLLGAECGNASNLNQHKARIQLLHAAGRDSPLASHMLPDDKDTWDDPKAALARMGSKKETVPEPAHLNDLTHAPMCLYMEFLTRIFDEQKVDGKRWFLGTIEAERAGLKGKKGHADK